MFIRTDKFELDVHWRRWIQVIWITYLVGLLSGIVFLRLCQTLVLSKTDVNDVFRSGNNVKLAMDN